MAILVAILAFGVLIAFHEAGHMWVARRCGMRVDRFSIGFGPVIFRFKRGETEYALSAIPLGGYVSIAGMSAEDGTDPADPRAFENRPVGARIATLLAGPFANYLLAFVIGIPLLLFSNLQPDAASTHLGDVVSGQPAALAGLQAGDDLRAVDGRPLTDWQSLRSAINTGAKDHPGKPVLIAYLRAGTPAVAPVLPRESAGSWVIGVSPASKEVPGLPLVQAVPVAFVKLYEQSMQSVHVLGMLFSGKAKVSDLSGPVGMISMTVEQAKKGFREYFATVWGLSVAIGFFNILPIPALDGGRVMFRLYELVARRRVNQKLEGYVHTFGLLALMGLMLFVTKGDIVHKFFS